MKEYLANRLVSISSCLTHCQFICVACAVGNPNNDQRVELSKYLNKMDEELKFLGLEMTRVSVVRTKSRVDAITGDELSEAVGDIEQRFYDEIRPLILFYIPLNKLAFYNKTDLFGDQFKTNFSVANAEISEAGNCFAFDRFTSCAFHLMRALEVVLKVLFSALDLPPIRAPGAQNWNGILRQVREKLDADRTITDYDFYDSAYAFLAAAKNPMRNATMHVDAVYDESSVRSVYDAVGAFIRHVATKLRETL